MLSTAEGSVACGRLVLTDLSLVGKTAADPQDRGRRWIVVGAFRAIDRRGPRVQLRDEEGFITFASQRDIELLLCLAKPGNLCARTGERYPELDDPSVRGMSVEEEDLLDDLYGREQVLRADLAAQGVSVLPYGHQVARKVHLGPGQDVEELLMVLYDCDPVSGVGPDTRFQFVEHRWTRVERTSVQWRQYGR